MTEAEILAEIRAPHKISCTFTDEAVDGLCEAGAEQGLTREQTLMLLLTDIRSIRRTYTGDCK